MGHNRSNAAAGRSPATNAEKSRKCANCNPLWDRQGNVKAIHLCGLHAATPLLAAKLSECVRELSTMGSEFDGLVAECRAALKAAGVE